MEDVARFPLSTYAAWHDLLLCVVREQERPGLGAKACGSRPPLSPPTLGKHFVPQTECICSRQKLEVFLKMNDAVLSFGPLENIWNKLCTATPG